MEIVYGSEKKKIIEKLSYYGIEKIPLLLIKFGKEKIRGYSGGLSTEELSNFERMLRVEVAGVYLFNESAEEIRLTIEAIHLLKNQITKNILVLNNNQAESWFRGEDLQIAEEWKNEKRGFKILKYKEDFIGCGKLTENRIVNYMPKERRVKGKN